MTLINPEATDDALRILRSGENFQWYVIFMLVVVLYVYFSAVKNKEWRTIVAGLTLYGIHWFVEIINAYIQYFSGHALWTVPEGTALLLLIGVGVELSLMFSIAGIVAAKLLPEDPNEKILGIPVKLAVGLFNAALASFLEIFLVMTPCFVWIYPWWGAFPVFILVYIPFFCGATYAYYWKPKSQKMVLAILWGIDILLLIFGLIFGWI